MEKPGNVKCVWTSFLSALKIVSCNLTTSSIAIQMRKSSPLSLKIDVQNPSHRVALIHTKNNNSSNDDLIHIQCSIDIFSY